MTPAAAPPGAAPATLAQVLDVLDALSAAGLAPCLFGGWAKELHGVWGHGLHHDVDVLVVTEDMASIDTFLAGRSADPAKRHAHKRGWWHEGVMVELFHVQPALEGLVSDFYGHLRRPWLSPLGCTMRTPDGTVVDVVTADNIAAYERDHPRIEDAFYAAFPAIRDEIVQRYGDLRMPYDKFFPAR